jgi:hypothetical protein
MPTARQTLIDPTSATYLEASTLAWSVPDLEVRPGASVRYMDGSIAGGVSVSDSG